MAILSQQQAEKDTIREVVTARHNLEDIQREQEFQQWWDQESRAVQEAAAKASSAKEKSNSKGRRKRGGGKGKERERND